MDKPSILSEMKRSTANGAITPELQKIITDIKERKNQKASKQARPSNSYVDDLDEYRAIYAFSSKSRKQGIVKSFLKNYTHASGSFNKDTRTCIWPGDSRSCLVDSSGITWVAVYGKSSICFATKMIQDIERVDGSFLKFKPRGSMIDYFMEMVIYQIEDRSLEGLDQSIERPFGIVSGIPATNKIHEENSCAVYDEDAAFEFLRKKVKKKSDFTMKDTIRTALSALQHLCRMKFKVSDIVVGILDEKDPFSTDLSVTLVKKHLAAINKVPKAEKVEGVEATLVSPPEKRKAKNKRTGEAKETQNAVRTDTFMNEFYPEIVPKIFAVARGLKPRGELMGMGYD